MDTILIRFGTISAACLAVLLGYLAVELPIKSKKASSKDVPEAVWKVARQSVVRIDIGGHGTGSCSGTIVSPTRFLTAAHCAPDEPQNLPMSPISIAPSVEICKDGTPLTVLRTYSVDACVMELNKPDAPVVAVDKLEGDIFTVDEAVLCGYPMFSDELRCTRATRIRNAGFAAVFDMVAIPGQSGGGVFSLDGKLIGILHNVTQDGYTQAASTVNVLSEDSKQPRAERPEGPIALPSP